VGVLVGIHHALAGMSTLAALERMPRHVTDIDEPDEEPSARLAELAEAIDAATPDIRRRAALVTLVRFESHAARYVMEGRCADGPCAEREGDAGRGKGAWQRHADARHPEIPYSLAGRAKIAVALWSYARRECGSDAGAFSLYGSGGSCDIKGWPEERAAYME